MINGEVRPDLVGVVVLLMTSFVGQQVAEAVGPYLVVIACSLVGSSFGLSRWRKCSVREGLGYVIGFTAVSTIFTFSCVDYLRGWVPTVEPRLLIAPTALVISAIGHEWQVVAKVLYEIIINSLRRRTAEADEPDSKPASGDKEK